MWTGVSAVIHAVLVGALCGVSYLGFAKREAASKAKLAVEEAATKKAEADEAAKAPAAAPKAPADAPKAAATPGVPAEKPVAAEKAPATPGPASAVAPATPTAPPDAPPIQAEKVLGIDKTAKPGEVLKSPFSGSSDDILKDLK
jgi:hypothetical protein